MKVSELQKFVDEDTTRVESVPLAEIDFDGRHWGAFDQRFELDDQALNQAAKFFGMPTNFMTKMPSDLLDSTLEWLRGQHNESHAIFEYQPGHILEMYHGSSRVIPRKRFVEVIQGVMPKSSEVRRWEWERGKVFCDVTSGRVMNVQPRRGDITEGGLRIVGYVAPIQQSPYAASYWHRLDCSNGEFHEEEGGLIKVRGNTVDEVIESLEENARRIFRDVIPQRLEQIEHMLDVRVQSPEQFVLDYAQRVGLGTKITQTILRRVPELDDDHRTEYDVRNLITAHQHEEDLPDRQRDLLMQLGGHIVAEASERHRCAKCQRLLPNPN